jgi:hypothetical protein
VGVADKRNLRCFVAKGINQLSSFSWYKVLHSVIGGGFDVNKIDKILIVAKAIIFSILFIAVTYFQVIYSFGFLSAIASLGLLIAAGLLTIKQKYIPYLITSLLSFVITVVTLYFTLHLAIEGFHKVNPDYGDFTANNYMSINVTIIVNFFVCFTVFFIASITHLCMRLSIKPPKSE